jgi:hypothetical protein
MTELVDRPCCCVFKIIVVYVCSASVKRPLKFPIGYQLTIVTGYIKSPVTLSTQFLSFLTQKIYLPFLALFTSVSIISLAFVPMSLTSNRFHHPCSVPSHSKIDIQKAVWRNATIRSAFVVSFSCYSQSLLIPLSLFATFFLLAVCRPCCSVTP